MAARLRSAPDLLRLRVIEELAAMGEQIVEDAKAAAPASKKHRGPGTTLKESIHYKIEALAAAVRLHVTPYTRGNYVAHLIERGVPEQIVRVYRKVYATRLQAKYTDASGRHVWRFKKPNRVKRANLRLKDRHHHVPAHPFFMPAVQRAGDVGKRLQDAVSSAAEDS